MVDIALVMTLSRPSMTPVRNGITGPVIRGQEQFAPFGGEGSSRRPADVSNRLAISLPRVWKDVLERKNLDRVAQAPSWSELLRRRVLGHVLVNLFSFKPAVLAEVLVDLVEKHRGSGGVFWSSVCALMHGFHDVLENEKKERVARSRSHPRIRNRVWFARVQAHSAKESLSTVLLQVIRRHRSRFRMRNCRYIVCLEQVI